MIFRLGADLIVLLHLAFIVAVVLGGLLVLWRPWIAVIHLPVAMWGAWIEFTRGTCPLTTLENALRMRAGQEGYTGGFIEHYLIPIIYPPGLTSGQQFVMGLVVIALNLAVYTVLLRRLVGGAG